MSMTAAFPKAAQQADKYRGDQSLIAGMNERHRDELRDTNDHGKP